MQARFLPVLILGLASSCLRAAAVDPDMLVGMLEEEPSAATAAPGGAHVRVLFRHSSAGWEALAPDCELTDCLQNVSAYPKRTSWWISLDGLIVGAVVGRTPAQFDRPSDIGVQALQGKRAPPFVGKPSVQYAGLLDEPVHRPLLASSGRVKPQRSSAGWQRSQRAPSASA